MLECEFYGIAKVLMRFLRLGRTEIKGAWAPVEGLEKTTLSLVYALRRCACAKSSLFIDSRNARGSRGQSQANVALSSSRLTLAALASPRLPILT